MTETLRRPGLEETRAIAPLVLAAAPSVELVLGDRALALRAIGDAFRSDRTVWGHRWALVAGMPGTPIGVLTAFPGRHYGSLALGTGVTLARAAGARHAAELTKRGRILNRLIAPVRRDTLFVSALAVDEAERGRGVGTALLERAIAGAAGMGLGVALDVAIEDETARKLYERLGFREVAARQTTIADRELIPVEGLLRMELPAGEA